MECKVLRDNADLEVACTISTQNIGYNTTIECEKINFHDSLTFQAKLMSFRIMSQSSYNTTEIRNIFLIKIINSDENDKSLYRLRLSCPECAIKQSVFYQDSHWHVLDENKKASNYSLKITIKVEPVAQVNFTPLYDDDLLTDFKLKAHDGEINIHKICLAAASDTFKSKLINDLKLVSLEVPETSVKTLQDFKKCIYLDVIPKENLKELLLIASYFKIIWLEFKCVDNIMANLTTSDAISMLEFAIKHSHMPLFLGIMDHVQSGKLKIRDIRKHYLQHM